MKLTDFFSKKLTLQTVHDGEDNYVTIRGGDGTLKGCPEKISDNFVCADQYLTSFEGGPKEVTGYFYAARNKIKSLKGAPTKVGDYFSCEDTPSLNSFDCDPIEVNGVMFFINTGFTSLKDIHKHIKRCERIHFTGCDIKSNILGLFLINNLISASFENKTITDIINRNLKNPSKPKGMIKAQRELIDADLDDFAEV